MKKPNYRYFTKYCQSIFKSTYQVYNLPHCNNPYLCIINILLCGLELLE